MERTASTAAHRLLALEVARRHKSAPQLAAACGLSERQVRRVLAQLPGIVSAGKASRTRYATARPLRGDAGAMPLYAIDENAQARELAKFSLTEPEGSLCDLSAHMPCYTEPDDAARDGWWDGLPYAAYHMQPVGYLGRQFARRYGPQLEVAPDPTRWGDDQIAWVLSRQGHDTSGSLVLGDVAMQMWLDAQQSPLDSVRSQDLSAHYAQLANEAMREGNPGRSAAGEFPKFTALREGGQSSQTPHVIVKFSAALQTNSGSDAAAQRWADLLLCEHLALQALRQHGIAAAQTRIIQTQGRTCLESERFDRVGLWGRKPLVSLQAAGDCLFGMADQSWPEVAQAFLKAKLITEATAHQIAVLWWFGRLIANTDMHHGNLSLWWRPGGFDLAPAYDMLPMAYAPHASGELRNPDWQPPLPLPAQQRAWHQAAPIAFAFWQEAADAAMSAQLKSHCLQNASRISLAIQRTG